MRKYPKFLKALPEFYGLGFPDLGLLMALLYLFMIFKINPLVGLAVSSIGIITFRFLRKNIDFKGWFLPRRKEIVLQDELIGGKHDSSL